MADEPIRILLAKVGLDGHDRGVKVVARALRDAGMEVVYTGLHRSPEEVVAAATQEDVDVIGVSLLSGAHMALFPRIIDLMKEREIFGDHLLLGGGVIPDEDVEELKKMGVDEIMGQDTPPNDIVDLVRNMVAQRGEPLVEDWSFPPRYDESYRPPPDQPYWFPERETMDPQERDAAILERLREVCAYAYENSPFYRAKWGDFDARTDLKTLRGLRAAAGDPQGRAARRPGRPPAVRLLHLHRPRRRRPRPRHERHDRAPDRVRHQRRGLARDRQRARPDHVGDGHPPRRHRVHRVASSRSTWARGRRSPAPSASAPPRSRSAPAWPARALRAVNWMAQMKPAAFYGTPSYALRLAEIAAEEGIDPRDFGVRILFFSGEPGASIPTIRNRIEELYGGKVFDCGSMAEMTPWMNLGESSAQAGMLCWQDVVYTEVCDPETNRRLPFGERGHARLHAPRAHQPADDPPAVRRPDPLGVGPEPVRPDLSDPPEGDLRPHRRHVHDPRRERVPRGDRRGPLRDGRLRRRAPHPDLPPGDDGQARGARRAPRRRRRRGVRGPRRRGAAHHARRLAPRSCPSRPARSSAPSSRPAA